MLGGKQNMAYESSAVHEGAEVICRREATKPALVRNVGKGSGKMLLPFYLFSPPV
ncbi:MAG: hypothetical protein HY277_05640 [Ignavibacteriales bacterium]|nr:hypothetical protein [Ignavibacteriales bacterium]